VDSESVVHPSICGCIIASTITYEAVGNVTRFVPKFHLLTCFTALVHLRTKLNRLDFPMKRSKVKVMTTRNVGRNLRRGPFYHHGTTDDDL